MTDAYDMAPAGLPLNISPASAAERLRVVAMSTGTCEMPFTLTGSTGTNAPCASCPAHPPQKIVDARAATVSKRILQVKRSLPESAPASPVRP